MAKDIPEDEKIIMKIFNVTDYNKIPKRTNEAMIIYFDFLNKNMVFPITGTHTSEIGPFKSETISVKLASFSQIYDDFYGILVEGRSDMKKMVVPLVDFEPDNQDDENFQLIDDYKTWFCNW